MDPERFGGPSRSETHKEARDPHAQLGRREDTSTLAVFDVGHGPLLGPALASPQTP